ncbi:MAG: hypothetical protein Q4F63_08575 [Clostridia bacterium]|nr:hypothetical protein [Clostridia bacterium]
MRKHISRIVSAFVAVTMFLYCAPLGAVSASGAEVIRRLIIPEAEGGELVVKRGNEVLTTGSEVEIGDTITLEPVPDVSKGYELAPDTTTVTKTLEESDFREYLTNKVTAEGWTALGGSTNYYGKYDGFIKKMPGDECGTESITFSVTPENMYEQTIYFDWSVDQAFTGFGQFKLHFYHNDKEVITYDFTSTANPYGNIMSEVYKYTPSGNEETFKWSFEKVASGDWEDDGGRKFYLGNIYHSTYNYMPDAPVFNKTNFIVTVENYYPEVCEYESTTATAGETVTFTPKDYYMYECESIKVTGVDGTEIAVEENNGVYSFTMPAQNVKIKLIIKSYLSISLPETVDNGTFTVKRGNETLVR